MSELERGAGPDRDTEQELVAYVAEDTGDIGNVIVHNDDVTPYDFVIVVIGSIFEVPWARAEEITMRAHVTGTAHVASLPLEEAKYRVGQAHGVARAAGYPLTFTIEPAHSA
jgi:ATP-dependent Clp protease adaptor protein ClpS